MDYIFKKISIDNPCIKNVLDKKPVWIGTISELHKTKGLEYSIQAVSKIDNCVFFIIGDGEEKENIEKLILELGLDQKVFLLGRIESASSYLKALMFLL
jgi:rhamnosyl/mannosyltransferase